MVAKSARRRASASTVGVAPGGASSLVSELLRSSTQSIPAQIPFVPSPRPYGSFPNRAPLWHKKGVKALSKARRAPPPLDDERLHELALRYVGKYATTRWK